MNPFSIQYNGLTINEGSGYGVPTLQGIDGLPIRISQQEKTGDNGGYVWRQLYGMRIIAFEGWISASSVSDYFAKKAALVNAFNISTTARTLNLTLWDGTTKSIDCFVAEQPQIVEKAGENFTCNYRIELIAPNPYWSDAEQTTSANLPVVGGFAIPFSIPFALGATSGGSATINYIGTIADYPEISLIGPLTNPSVSNSAAGESFSLETTILAGQVVNIYRNQEGLFVLSNGINLMPFFRGSFFKLVPGQNVISFNASNYDANASLNITYSNKYIV